jgi:hypothetical protein
MELSPSGEAASCSATQELRITGFLDFVHFIKSRNPVILNVIHHGQNSLESI